MRDYHRDPIDETVESFQYLLDTNNEIVEEENIEKSGGSATKKLDRMLGLS
jgi:hypothetical protein